MTAGGRNRVNMVVPWPEVTGVDGKYATMHQTQIREHREQGNIKANSPRRFLGSGKTWRWSAA